jgi:hypothetical protein
MIEWILIGVIASMALLGLLALSLSEVDNYQEFP